jgi:uncharacterized membrane protein YgaE (UPF0421/DUF939 family)
VRRGGFRPLGDIRTVQLAWRDQAEGARQRLRSSLSPAAQAAVAAGLSWLVAHDLLGHAQPFFAPIAAAIALSTSNVRRGRRILQMVFGVMLGIAVGEAASAVMGTSAIAVGLVVLVTMAAALVAGISFFGEGMMFVNQSAASAILVLALHRHGTGPERLLDALVGGAVAGVIGVGLFPADPLAVMRDAESEVLRSLAGALGRVADLLGSGTPAEPEWTMAAAQDIHVQLSSLTQARLTARANVRVAPRRWRLREVVELEDVRVSRLDLLANVALSLFRVATDALDEGEPIPPGLCAGIRQLSEILDTLSRAPQPWTASEQGEVTERVSLALAAVGASGAARSPVLASLVRSTGRDVLAILPEQAR